MFSLAGTAPLAGRLTSEDCGRRSSAAGRPQAGPAPARPPFHSQRQGLPLVSGEDDFERAICQSEVVAVDWMAKWCRKCLYLKPKLQKLMQDDFPDVPLVFVDVNAVPGALVYRQGIKKMPTIAVYRRGEKVAEHIAAEGSIDALMKVKRMLQLNAAPEPVT